jgi:GR25 family glycosyltransferase involved in LPS biosynthesis
MEKSEGLNNFDIVYYINLKHRTDRLESFKKVLEETNIDPLKINRIEGKYLESFGILGCAKSHILALEAFIKTPDEIDNCIIFEDDFVFTQDFDKINIMINNFFNQVKTYDVLMLASNTFKSIATKFSFITKILDAQTLSGYSVSKKFAPILLENIKESVILLERVGRSIHNFCPDIHMKKLQPKSNWFCLYPKIGKQKESYSDIENRVVSYNC